LLHPLRLLAQLLRELVRLPYQSLEPFFVGLNLGAFLRDRALTLREAVNLLFIQTELLAQKLPFFAQFLLKAFAVMQSQRLAA